MGCFGPKGVETKDEEKNIMEKPNKTKEEEKEKSIYKNI